MAKRTKAIDDIRRILKHKREATIIELDACLSYSSNWIRQLATTLCEAGVFRKRWIRVNGKRVLAYSDTGAPLPDKIRETDEERARRLLYQERQRLSRQRQRKQFEAKRKREQERINKRKKRIKAKAHKRFTIDPMCPACGEVKLIVEPREVETHDVKMRSTSWECSGCGDFLYLGDCISYERLSHAYACWQNSRENQDG